MDSIVITGCTRGLGRALTLFFASKGWIVHGCGTHPEALEELRALLPAPHSFTRVDVTDDSAVGHWAQGVLKSGAPRMLINNAARIARNAPLWELSAKEVDPVLEVNIKGVIHVIRHFLPAMIQRQTGVVVNISSGWGRSTSPGVASYCATKFAIEGLTSALAQEIPPGLAAVSVNPGVIQTDMLTSCFGESASAYPRPDEWIQKAGPFLLALGPSDNGSSLDIPGA